MPSNASDIEVFYFRCYIFHLSHSCCRRDTFNKSSLPPSTPAPPSFIAKKSRNGQHDLSTTNERPRPLTEAPTPPASPRAMLQSGVPPSRLPATLPAPRYSPAAPEESGGGAAARHNRAQGHAATAAAMAGREPSASKERAGRADGQAVTPPVPIGCSSPSGPRPASPPGRPRTFRRAPGVRAVCREATWRAGTTAERGLGSSGSRRTGCSSLVDCNSRKEPEAPCWLLLLLLFRPSGCVLHEHSSLCSSLWPRWMEDNPWRFSPWR